MHQLTTNGNFPHGLVIAGTTYTRFEMREALLADMIEAEVESGGPTHAIHYSAQLAVRQLTRVTNGQGDEFTGPFVVAMVKKRGDYTALRQAQIKLDDMGNGATDGSASTGTPSS